MILHSSTLTILIVAALTCLPPLLALRLSVLTYRRAQRRHMPRGRFIAAIALTLAIFLYNLGAVLGMVIAASQGNPELGRIQFIAIGLAWITFWVWLFLASALGRDMGKRSGLR